MPCHLGDDLPCYTYSTLLTLMPRCVPRTWIGGRILQNLVRHGMLDDALKEMRPFVDR